MRHRQCRYFEADLTAYNPFRDDMTDTLPYVLDADGCVSARDGVGIGLRIDPAFVARIL